MLWLCRAAEEVEPAECCGGLCDENGESVMGCILIVIVCAFDVLILIGFEPWTTYLLSFSCLDFTILCATSTDTVCGTSLYSILIHPGSLCPDLVALNGSCFKFVIEGSNVVG